MKKATCTTFETILNTIRNEGITTKSALIANQQLYAQFWMATEDFVHFALASKNGKTTKKGKRLSGNSTKIDILENYGVTTKEDVVMDCVARIVEYTDHILRKPSVAYMKNYTFSIINSVVNNIFRKFFSNGFKIISLNSTIEGTNISAEDAYTYEDIISDNTYNPERLVLEHENITELTAILKSKIVKEKIEKGETIIREITLLSKRPAEVLVRLACFHLFLKPRELASMIIDEGCESTYAKIIFAVAKEYNIEIAEIRSIIANHLLTAESVKANTHSTEEVSSQISRLVYRAGKRLIK